MSGRHAAGGTGEDAARSHVVGDEEALPPTQAIPVVEPDASGDPIGESSDTIGAAEGTGADGAAEEAAEPIDRTGDSAGGSRDPAAGRGDPAGGSGDPVIATAEAWLAQDPDPETQAQLRMLISGARDGDTSSLADLHSRFDERLAFGTAGLRGEIAAGSNRMNRVLVSQAAAGLAAYLLEKQSDGGGASVAEGVDGGGASVAEGVDGGGASVAEGDDGEVASVVIGYDGRKNSQIFAIDTAEIMSGAGVRAILLPRLLPTPVLAFAVRHLGASAGVMVTASHNPANDNGYKVYLGGENGGSQIIAPDDALIAAAILQVASSVPVPDMPRGAYETADESVVQAYIEATASIAAPPRAQVNAVYTAMHGVGWDTTRRTLEAAGFELPTLVDAQIAPNPAFPTVAFPNPEEPGAMDLSYETAREANAELIIANDPDADRLAVAIPDPSAAEGYRRLSGNEVGAILGWRAAQLAVSASQAAGAGDRGPVGTLACSIVSTPALKAVADAYGLDFANTLTGFKWVSRAPGLIFGFEEALGYLVNPGTVRDKDGISAAVAFLSLASELKADGVTIASHLDSFSEKFGHYESGQISVRVTDLTQITTVMTRMREAPPEAVGGIRVDRIEDLRDGFEGLPTSDVLRIWLADGSRVMVRPSGTEPKLKVYIDTHSSDGSIAERKAAAAAALAALDAGMRELIG